MPHSPRQGSRSSGSPEVSLIGVESINHAVKSAQRARHPQHSFERHSRVTAFEATQRVPRDIRTLGNLYCGEVLDPSPPN